MPEFLVAADDLELPRDTVFTTISHYHYESGALVLFKIGSQLSIGRLLRDIGGNDWILQPEYLICLIGSAITIQGEVVLHEV
jgi:hypothetical protein